MISRGLIDEMRARARATPDVEICGLLLGQDGVILEARPCANVASDPSDSFEVDPVALIGAHRAARQGELRFLGHYHSHPKGPARPSPRDTAAADPGVYWIIIGSDGLACWYARSGAPGEMGFDAVELIATD